MTTGLKFKQSTIKVGNINIQPLKPVQQETAQQSTIIKKKIVSTTPVPQIYTKPVAPPKIPNLKTTFNTAKFDGLLPKIENLQFSPFGGLTIKPKLANFIKPVELKGISEQRPTIVGLTDYSPVFKGNQSFEFTDVGDMLTVAIEGRKLRFEHIKKLLSSLQQTEDAKNILDELASQYSAQIDSAKNTVSFMESIVTTVRNIKRALDIRKDANLVGVNQGQSVVKTRSYEDFLINEFGFSDDGVVNFSNTKLYAQFLFDSYNVISQYSPELLGTNDGNLSNSNAFNQQFSLGGNGNTSVGPTRGDDKSFSDLIIKRQDITDGEYKFRIELFSDLNQVFVGSTRWNDFMDILPEDTLSRVLLLTAIVSKEFRVSRAMGIKRVRDKLSSTFNAPENGDPFEFVLGLPPNSISEKPIGDSSLMSLMRYENANSDIILPFETFYVRDTNGRLYTPGSEGLVDQILEQEPLFEFEELSAFADNFEFISRDATDVLSEALQIDDDKSKIRTSTLFDSIIDDFIEYGETLLSNTGQDITGDFGTFLSRELPPIWGELFLAKTAAVDIEIKQLLFQYVLCAGLIGKPGATFGSNKRSEFFGGVSSEMQNYGAFPAIKNFQGNIEQTVATNLISLLQQTGQSGIGSIVAVNTLETTSTEDTIAGYSALAFIVDRLIEAIRSKNSGVTAEGDSFVRYDDLVEHLLSLRELSVINDIIDRLAQLYEEGGAGTAFTSGKSRYNRISYTSLAAMVFEIYVSYMDKVFAGVSEASAAPVNTNANGIFAYVDLKSVFRPAVSSQRLSKFINPLSPNVEPGDTSVPAGAVFYARQQMAKEQRLEEEIVNRIIKTTERVNKSISDAESFFNLNGPNSSRFQELLDSVDGQDKISLLSEGQFILARKALDDLETGAGLALFDSKPIKQTSSQLEKGKGNFLKFDPFVLKAKIGKVDFDPNANKYPAFLDQTVISDNEIALMRLLFSLPAFREGAAENLKILSVGLPAGFSEHFQTEVSINEKKFNSINDKQKDVVQINVYRKSIEFEDIIFKPRPYIFETSRFVSRSSLASLDIPNGFNPQALASFGVTFMKDFSKRAKGNDVNIAGLALSPEYSFLSNDQKFQMIFNHLTSYLLEVYVKLLTGVSFDESEYLVNRDVLIGVTDIDTRNKFRDLILAYVEGVTGQPLTIDQLKNSSPQIKLLLDKIDNFGSEAALTQQINPPVLPGVSRSSSIEVGEDIINFLKLYTPRSLLTGGFEQRKRIESPKLFERIFNLAVDPDDFEIDVQETIKTSSGKAMYDALLAKGLIDQNNKITPRDPNRNIQFDQFFVTISTVS